MKNAHRCSIFSNLGSGQQYLSNDIKKIRQKWLVKQSKFVCNGIFAFGVGFFFRQVSTFQLDVFGGIFFYIIQKALLSWA